MITPTELPGISLDPQRITLKVGEKSSFSCMLTEESLPVTFEWLKNGELLQSSNKITIRSSEWASNLIIKSISVIEAGNYTCRASNSQGSSQSTSILTVEGIILSISIENTLS